MQYNKKTPTWVKSRVNNDHMTLASHTQPPPTHHAPQSPPQRITHRCTHCTYDTTHIHTHTRQQTTRNRFNSFYQFICHIYLWNKTITIVNFSTSSEIWAHLIIMTSEIRNIDVNISAKPEKPPLSKFFWKILKFTKKMLIYIQTYIDSNFEKNNVNSLWFFV